MIEIKGIHKSFEDKQVLIDINARFEDGKTNLIKMSISQDMMVITSNNESGDIYEEIACQKFGADLVISFNVRFISDTLKNLDDEKLVMLFNSPFSPGTVVPDEGDSFLYLVLPVRTH